MTESCLVPRPREDTIDQAFNELFRQQRGRVFNYCLRMVARRDTAEDLTQEVFIKALTALSHNPALADSPVVWLLTVARNQCLDHLRRQKSWRQAVVRIGRMLAGQPSESPVDQDLLDRYEGLWLLQQLNPRQRSLLVLKDCMALSYEQIAEMLGTTPGSVGVMLHRARARATRLLQRREGA